MRRVVMPAKCSGGHFAARRWLLRARRSCSNTCKRSHGFSLIELLVALAVGVILIMFAIPNFTLLVNNYRLKTTANAVIGSLNTARMAAVQRNAGVQFCSNLAANNATDLLGKDCSAVSPAEVLALLGPGAGAPVEILQPPSEVGLSSSSIYIHGNIVAIRFNGQGQGLQPATNIPVDTTAAGAAPVVDVCSTALSTANHIQVNIAAGSIITTTTPFTGACP